MASGTVTSDSAKSPTNPNIPRKTGNQSNSNQDASDFEKLVDEVSTSVVTYARRQPKVVAAGIFALGFVIGWKIKPW